MIREIGGYLHTDTDGYLVPDVAWSKIQPHWQSLLDKIIEFTENQQDRNIVSLYVRGSVPRGIAVDYISDLDLVFLCAEKVDKTPDHIRHYKAELLAQFPFCKGIEWPIYHLAELDNKFPPLAVMLKTQALFLWGNDVTHTMPKHKAGSEMMSQVFWIEKDWATYPDDLAKAKSQEEVDKLCLWMGKIILRSMFELSALQTPRFTRDLYWCYAGAAEVFPEIKEKLYAVLQLSLQADVPRDAILPVFAPVVDFAVDRIKELKIY